MSDEEKASRNATIALAVAVALGLVASAGRYVVAVVSVVMFVAGAVLMATALWRAAQRSREEAVTIGGVFFEVPKPLLYSLGAQVVIAFVSAGAHPNTGAAFAILAPVGGLGLCGRWGARHARFPARET